MDIKEENKEIFIDYSIVKEEYSVQEVQEEVQEAEYYKFDEKIKKENEISTNQPESLQFVITEVTEKNFQCSHCPKAYDEARKLKRHLEVHSDQKDFLCPECPKAFSKRNRLNAHMKNHSEKAFHCQQCSKSFRSKTLLNRHFECHITVKNFKCSQCPHAFVSQRRLNDHVQKRHSNNSFSTCHICHKITNHLQRHLKTHGGDLKKYECEKCGRQFNDRQDITRHMLRIHYGRKSQARKLTNPNAFGCPYCDKVLYTKFDLRMHLRTHDFAKDFSCPICPKKFKLEGSVKNHMLVHSTERPFVCKICQKTFKTHSHLKSHHTVHIEDPSDCPYCNIRSKNEKCLERHIRRHHREMLPPNA